MRRLGLRGFDEPVLLRTRSIHTFGLDRAIVTLWIDEHGRVESVRRVSPRRVVARLRPYVVIETSDLADVPRRGDEVTGLP